MIRTYVPEVSCASPRGCLGATAGKALTTVFGAARRGWGAVISMPGLLRGIAVVGMESRYRFAAAATLLAGVGGSLVVAPPGLADPTPPTTPTPAPTSVAPPSSVEPTTSQNSGPGYAKESYDGQAQWRGVRVRSIA